MEPATGLAASCFRHREKVSSVDLKKGKLVITMYLCTLHFNVTLDMHSGVFFLSSRKPASLCFSFLKNIADIHLGLIFNLLRYLGKSCG